MAKRKRKKYEISIEGLAKTKAYIIPSVRLSTATVTALCRWFRQNEIPNPHRPFQIKITIQLHHSAGNQPSAQGPGIKAFSVDMRNPRPLSFPGNRDGTHE